jgi:hypothetical protein
MAFASSVLRVRSLAFNTLDPGSAMRRRCAVRRALLNPVGRAARSDNGIKL